MPYLSSYTSPLGEISLIADAQGLTGLWLDTQPHCASLSPATPPEKVAAIFLQTRKWLDTYFSGHDPGPTPPLHFSGSPFEHEVWTILTTIHYAHTLTYGEIARQIASRRGIARMSAQAVGGAVGRNPISIIIPCHRVVGTNGSLTGYTGGLDKKIALLELEGLLTPVLTPTAIPTRSPTSPLNSESSPSPSP